MITLVHNFIVQLPKRLRSFLLKIYKLFKSILTFLKPDDWKEEFLDCILMYTLISIPYNNFCNFTYYINSCIYYWQYN